MPDPRPASLAVLIDADNTSARYAHAIFEEIAKFVLARGIVALLVLENRE